jgi:thiol-disulfide isomerase/thioredoxin
MGETRSPLFYGAMAVAFAVFCIPLYFLMQLRDDGSSGLRVVELDRRTFFPTVAFPPQEDLQGEDEETIWAVFFYKPSCGSCRRIKPAFHALAKSTNSTQHIRFAAVNCVKDKGVCTHQGVDKQPTILLYKTKWDNSVDPPWGKREPVAQWRGMLIAYELFAWFQQAQLNGIIPKEVEWPTNDELGAAILKIKADAHEQGNLGTPSPLRDPGSREYRMAYLPAVDAAFRMSLQDAVFTAKYPKLKSSRRKAMTDYLDAAANAMPNNVTRRQAGILRDAVKHQSSWTEAEFEAAVQIAGLNGTITDESWVGTWCEITGPGVGGYPCGLWVMFHVLMANSDRFTGQSTLHAIHKMVTNFFGCTECAAHFQAMWTEYDGESYTGHIETSTWLWDAHNRVRARVYKDDTVQKGTKYQWPQFNVCETCYDELTRSSEAFLDPEVIPQFDEHDDSLWDKSYTFDFLQEYYCFGSDSFTCSQFYDPSIGVERDNMKPMAILLGALGCFSALLCIGYVVVKSAFGVDEAAEEGTEVAAMTVPSAQDDSDSDDSAGQLRQRKLKANGVPCRECGAACISDDAFCPSCGAKAPTTAAPAVKESAPRDAGKKKKKHRKAD